MSTSPQIPSILAKMLNLPSVSDAVSAAGEDLSGLLHPPAGVNPYPGQDQDTKSAMATEATQQDQGRKAAGYSPLYRAMAPVAQSVGVNVPGMEESASRGSVGGVLGHAAAPLMATAGGLAVHALAGEHPTVASEALQEHEATGGSTMDPRTGKNLAGSRKIAVGIAPEAASISDRPFTPEQYTSYVAQNRDLLAQHPNLAVGTHFDPGTGLHHMELVGTTPSKTAANALASHLGEDHAFNLATDEQIPTGVTGDRVPSHLSIGERIEQLNNMSPQKQPYSGMHYSDAKLDMLDGSRRGQPGNNGMTAGAEAARVRLGTTTGLGQDAPPGFYSYKAGSLPDNGVALRKNAYQVRGSMAFGNTQSPEFLDAYHGGVETALNGGADRATAHALGLNAAENALKDAGFDGYMNPAHPNIRFHFGNSDVQPVAMKQVPQIDWGAIKDPALSDVEAAQKGRAKELQAKYPGKTVEPIRDPFDAPAQPAYVEPTWPANYRQPVGTDGGGANYSSSQLAEFKARHGIQDVPSEPVGAK